MTSPRFVVLVLALIAATAAGCSPEIKYVDAPTQVTLRISSPSEALRAQLTALRVTVATREGDKWTSSEATVPRELVKWPVELPVTPRAGREEQRQFEVVVDALGDSGVLAQARAITGFVPGKRTVLDVSLDVCPGRELGFVCAKPGCHGESCTVCTPNGACQSVGGSSPVDVEVDSPVDVEVDSPVDVDSSDGGSSVSMDAGGTATPVREASVGGEDADMVMADAGDACGGREGAWRCGASERAARMRCASGRWTLAEPCPADQVCTSSAGGAAECVDCTRDADCMLPGLAHCSSGRCMACSVNAHCPASQSCQDGACMAEQRCGDGVRAGSEECDDGNTIDTDACISCKKATCGDGFLQAGVEECEIGIGGFWGWNVGNCSRATCTRKFWTPCTSSDMCEGPTACLNGLCAPVVCPRDITECGEAPRSCPLMPGFDVYQDYAFCLVQCTTTKQCPQGLTCSGGMMNYCALKR